MNTFDTFTMIVAGLTILFIHYRTNRIRHFAIDLLWECEHLEGRSILMQQTMRDLDQAIGGVPWELGSVNFKRDENGQ